MKRILIIGGGFAGVYTAKYLISALKGDSTVEIVLLNDNNFFLFTPLLHEVATGSLNRHHIVTPIREILHAPNFRFVECKAEKILYNQKTVRTSVGNYSYDYLVIATGAQASFFGIPGAKTYALPLKTVKDANTIRNAVILNMEKATLKSRKQREQHMTFVVVGGGPTGVEFVGELVQFLDQIIKQNKRDFRKEDVTIYLVQRGKKIMQMFHNKCIIKTTRKLEKKGVTILLNSSVEKVGSNYVIVKTSAGRKKIKTHTVVWTAGVATQPVPQHPQITNKYLCQPVNKYLETNQEGVYSLGDCSYYVSSNETRPVPRLAQAAQKAAKVCAYNIAADLQGHKKKPFIFKPSGLLVSVGKHWAVAELGPLRFKGFFAWWLWRTIYLFKMIGWSNRFFIAYEWTINLFFRRDTSQI